MAPCSLPRKKSSSRQSMHVKLRYVERRGDRSGGERWYWHRRGHKLTRLPDDLAARITMAEQLNAAADRVPLAEFARGSIAWVIQRYRDSDQDGAPQPRHHSVLQSVLAGYRGAWARPTLHLVYAPRGGRFHRDLCEAASAAPGGRGTQEPLRDRPLLRDCHHGRGRAAPSQNHPPTSPDLHCPH